MHRALLLTASFVMLSACGAAPDEAKQVVDVNNDAAVVYTGAFTSLNHETSGGLRIELDETGDRVIFLDDFAVLNGPALVVGLSRQPTAGMNDGNAWPDDTVDLGDLAGARGAQEYDIPEGTDVDAFSSVVIWCEDFFVAFGAGSFAKATD